MIGDMAVIVLVTAGAMMVLGAIEAVWEWIDHRRER